MYVLIIRMTLNDSPDFVTHLPSGTVQEARDVIRQLYQGVEEFREWGQFTALEIDQNKYRHYFVFDICAIDPLPLNLLRD